jgi:1-acyl-sn-glycerol-3-phosphate acyltransferase
MIALTVLRSLLFAVFQIVTVIPYAFACMIWSPAPLSWRYKLTMGWPALAVWGAKVICGVKWRIIGEENFPDGQAVVLSKHQSAWETLFLPSHLPREVCFVYKRELHRVPFFGWGLALLDMIPIDRSKGRDSFEQVVKIGKIRLDQGRWPILFPEGTRIAPGKMGRFKMGGALLAVRTQAPVIPIALNAGECWPRNAWLKRPGLITVSIGPPIPSTGKTADELNAAVYDWIDAEMRRLNPERYPATA